MENITKKQIKQKLAKNRAEMEEKLKPKTGQVPKVRKYTKTQGSRDYRHLNNAMGLIKQDQPEVPKNMNDNKASSDQYFSATSELSFHNKVKNAHLFQMPNGAPKRIPENTRGMGYADVQYRQKLHKNYQKNELPGNVTIIRGAADLSKLNQNVTTRSSDFVRLCLGSEIALAEEMVNREIALQKSTADPTRTNEVLTMRKGVGDGLQPSQLKNKPGDRCFKKQAQDPAVILERGKQDLKAMRENPRGMGYANVHNRQKLQKNSQQNSLPGNVTIIRGAADLSKLNQNITTRSTDFVRLCLGSEIALAEEMVNREIALQKSTADPTRTNEVLTMRKGVGDGLQPSQLKNKPGDRCYKKQAQDPAVILERGKQDLKAMRENPRRMGYADVQYRQKLQKNYQQNELPGNVTVIRGAADLSKLNKNVTTRSSDFVRLCLGSEIALAEEMVNREIALQKSSGNPIIINKGLSTPTVNVDVLQPPQVENNPNTYKDRSSKKRGQDPAVNVKRGEKDHKAMRNGAIVEQPNLNVADNENAAHLQLMIEKAKEDGRKEANMLWAICVLTFLLVFAVYYFWKYPRLFRRAVLPFVKNKCSFKRLLRKLFE